MTKSFTRIFLAGLTLGCMTTLAVANGLPVKLEIETPDSKLGLPLLSESGWPLTIKMVVKLDQRFTKTIVWNHFCYPRCFPQTLGTD